MVRQEFSERTKKQALLRQEYKCASCGEAITSFKQIGKKSHKYGEGACAHHMKHCQHGGSNMLSNCVILCESCHYSVHQGGHYRNKAKYLVGKATDFAYYRRAKKQG